MALHLLFNLLLCVALWYNLPLARLPLLGEKDLKLFELFFLALIAFYSLIGRQQAFSLLRGEPVVRRFALFALWASLLSLGHFLLGGAGNPGVLLSFFLRLWGAFFVFIHLRLHPVTSRTTLNMFFVLAAANSAAILAQSRGWLPLLFDEKYAAYGIDAFSGLLSPNRTLPGHAHFLALAAWALFKEKSNHPVRHLLLDGLFYFLNLGAILVSGSRTAWVVTSVYFVCIPLLARRRFFLTMIVLLLSAFLVVQIMETQVQHVVQRRVLTKIQYGDTTLEMVDSVDAGRLDILQKTLHGIGNHPLVLLVGTGVYQAGSVIGAQSAHNMYLNMVVEHGLLGFTLWFLFFIQLGRYCLGHANPHLGALFLALATSLAAGEILYAYRPAQAFLAMFFLVLASAMNLPEEARQRFPARSLLRSQTPVFG